MKTFQVGAEKFSELVSKLGGPGLDSETWETPKGI
jgi:hypothetical protein